MFPNLVDLSRQARRDRPSSCRTARSPQGRRPCCRHRASRARRTASSRRSATPSTSKVTSRSSICAPAGSPSPLAASISLTLQFGDAADADGTRMLMISISASKRCPYSASCARWKPSFSRFHPGVVDRPRRRVEANLVALPGVAAICKLPHDAAISAGTACRPRAVAPTAWATSCVEAGASRLRLVEPLDLMTLGGNELVVVDRWRVGLSRRRCRGRAEPARAGSRARERCRMRTAAQRRRPRRA